MLKKHAQFFKSLFIISDLLTISVAWIFSYVLRFYTSLIRAPLLGTPSFLTHIEFLLPLWVLWGLVSVKIRLHQPRRMGHFFKECLDIAKGMTLTLLLLIAVTYLFRRFDFSRLAFVYFWVISIVGLTITRLFARKTLRILRKRGYNQR